MISDLGNRVLDYEASDWINLTPKEMMTCYTTICKRYRDSLAAYPDVEDQEHRVKIMYDAVIENNQLLFYFCQRYPRQFHTLTNRTVPKWYWQNFLHFFYQTQLFVEQNIMTIERRQTALEEKFSELQPADDSWQRNEDYKTYLLMPRKFVVTPELQEAIRNIRQSRQTAAP
jgi:hypothetical protein